MSELLNSGQTLNSNLDHGKRCKTCRWWKFASWSWLGR